MKWLILMGGRSDVDSITTLLLLHLGGLAYTTITTSITTRLKVVPEYGLAYTIYCICSNTTQ